MVQTWQDRIAGKGVAGFQAGDATFRAAVARRERRSLGKHSVVLRAESAGRGLEAHGDYTFDNISIMVTGRFLFPAVAFRDNIRCSL